MSSTPAPAGKKERCGTDRGGMKRCSKSQYQDTTERESVVLSVSVSQKYTCTPKQHQLHHSPPPISFLVSYPKFPFIPPKSGSLQTAVTLPLILWTRDEKVGDHVAAPPPRRAPPPNIHTHVNAHALLETSFAVRGGERSCDCSERRERGGRKRRRQGEGGRGRGAGRETRGREGDWQGG